MADTLEATRPLKPRLVMAPNADPGCEGVRRAIADAGVEPIEHLPRRRFLVLLKGAGVIVGNSSAGLIEAAALRTPAVNVGPRQAGRERPRHVVDCDYGRANVEAAIDHAFNLDLKAMRHPYGAGNTGQRVADLLAATDLNAIPLRKRNRY
jgi:UDP-N-acetylglucosamine 2-epimerase